MHTPIDGKGKPQALSLLASQRPRNVSWLQAGGLLFGDWGTSRLYVLGLAFFFAGRTSFYLILAMSGLILAVGWAYTQICRIYPDGGGVYTAAKHKSRTLAVIGALLLFADYTVTASLSALDAFHYFGFPLNKHALVEAGKEASANPTKAATVQDGGDQLDVHRDTGSSVAESLFAWDSPGLWAIVAILMIGAFNLMGPKHTGGFALFAALGMMAITLTVSVAAIPQISWRELPQRIGHIGHHPGDMWVAFVSIVLALSGVEAIANLTGVMKKPVMLTASKAIWIVAAEVAVFNIVLAIAMLAIFPIDRDAHVNDMMAFLSSKYVGIVGEWGVRILGGTLLLSAANTAITDMISVQYLMARDGEIPQFMQKLNRFGVPWIAALVAATVPAFVLIISHDLESLAALYAIGVIGAVAINVSLCAIHPRLRKWRRKVPMILLGLILLSIWVTLAFTKLQALLFVGVVMAVGLSARFATRWFAARHPKPSLLRQAVHQQLPPEALNRRKFMLATYGSEALAPAALELAAQQEASLVVCFIRHVTLSFKYDGQKALGFDTDTAAQKTFARFLDLGHEAGVPIIPMYDTGPNAAELIAELAAMNGVEKVLIGSSRQGTLHHIIKGSFQRRLESLLPPDIHVQVISLSEQAAATREAAEGVGRMIDD